MTLTADETRYLRTWLDVDPVTLEEATGAVVDLAPARAARGSRRWMVAAALAVSMGVGATVVAARGGDAPAGVAAGGEEPVTAEDVAAAVREWKAQMVQVPWQGGSPAAGIYRPHSDDDPSPEVTFEELKRIFEAKPCPCDLGPGVEGPPAAYLTYWTAQHAFEPKGTPAPEAEERLLWVVEMRAVPGTSQRGTEGNPRAGFAPEFLADHFLVIDAMTGERAGGSWFHNQRPV